MIDREFTQKEYDEARLQRDEAQQRYANAQQQIAQLQQVAAQAQTAALVAEGAVQQAKAFLQIFEVSDGQPPTPVPPKRRTRKSRAHPTPAAE